VKALAVVAAVVVLGAALWAYRSRPQVEAVTPVTSSSAVALPAPAPSSETAEVVVAVSGKVRRPGLVRLPAGARVADAVEAAGGAQPGADLTSLNLARRVVDGELIPVGVTPPPGVGGTPGGGPGALPGKVNLNTATLQELDSLPGVGPVLAQRILDHRESSGGFRSVGELRNVDGIGASRFEDLKDLVTT
jgi:competence protein ComEA